MKRAAMGAVLATGLIALVFSAGFFHGPAAARPARTDPPSPPAAACAAPSLESERHRGFTDLRESGDGGPRATEKPGGLLAMTSLPAYRRAADLSLRVPDCAQAEDDLEAKLQASKGEILEMLMEGTEGQRTCTLTALIPSDRFRDFIADLRKMGKVQSERITASKLKPGEERAPVPGGAPDPRELSIVSIRMADEKVAPVVLESRGVLAASFDESASHFLKGMAVLVELVGYALPFLIALSVVLAPFLAILRFRRARALAARA
jgi:hypothetical protein